MVNMGRSSSKTPKWRSRCCADDGHGYPTGDHAVPDHADILARQRDTFAKVEVYLGSRGLPTAVRNCTRDEGGPGRQSGVGLKPPQAAVVKSDGGEGCGNAGTRIPGRRAA